VREAANSSLEMVRLGRARMLLMMLARLLACFEPLCRHSVTLFGLCVKQARRFMRANWAFESGGPVGFAHCCLNYEFAGERRAISLYRSTVQMDETCNELSRLYQPALEAEFSDTRHTRDLRLRSEGIGSDIQERRQTPWVQ